MTNSIREILSDKEKQRKPNKPKKVELSGDHEIDVDALLENDLRSKPFSEQANALRTAEKEEKKITEDAMYNPENIAVQDVETVSPLDIHKDHYQHEDEIDHLRESEFRDEQGDRLAAMNDKQKLEETRRKIEAGDVPEPMSKRERRVAAMQTIKEEHTNPNISSLEVTPKNADSVYTSSQKTYVSRGAGDYETFKEENLSRHKSMMDKIREKLGIGKKHDQDDGDSSMAQSA